MLLTACVRSIYAGEAGSGPAIVDFLTIEDFLAEIERDLDPDDPEIAEHKRDIGEARSALVEMGQFNEISVQIEKSCDSPYLLEVKRSKKDAKEDLEKLKKIEKMVNDYNKKIQKVEKIRKIISSKSKHYAIQQQTTFEKTPATESITSLNCPHKGRPIGKPEENTPLELVDIPGSGGVVPTNLGKNGEQVPLKRAD
jgi:hypothetical protein